MKKTFTKSVIAVTVGALTLSSCIGSFGLTNSVLSWNKRATDNKFVNELIFILISPAYAVCSVADPDGEKSYFVFNKKNKSWSYSKDGDIRELFSFNEDGSIQACLPSGAKMNVTADENGLYQLRMAMNDGFYYAFNK